MNAKARAFAGLIAVIALASVLSQLRITAMDNPDKSLLGASWINLRYFTILTNWLVFATFGAVALGRLSGRAGWLGGVTLWISIVGAVYHLLLANYDGKSTIGLMTDHGLHTVVPALTALWWLSCAPKRGLGWRLAIVWLAWPTFYVIYALTRGAADGIYPYFFTDLPKLGWAGIAYWFVLLNVGFFFGGLLLIGIAKMLSRSAPVDPAGSLRRGSLPR